jgi:hypothetical protein
MLESSSVAAQLAASQDELSSLKLVVLHLTNSPNVMQHKSNEYLK